MKVLNGLRTNIPKIIPILRDRFGVPGRIYSVKDSTDEALNYKDNSSIEYNDVPIYDGKLLITGLLKEVDDRALEIFETGDNQINLYCTTTEEYPEKSLVVLDSANTTGVKQFVVYRRNTYKDDDTAFYYEYNLVPETNLRERILSQDIADAVEISDIKIDSGTVIPDPVSTEVENTPTEFTRNPIG